MHLIVTMSDKPAFRLQTWGLIAIVAILALIPREARAQSTVTLAWDETQASPVSGYSVSIDGVSTDYGLTPVGSSGTCGCSLALTVTGGQHTIVITAYNSAGQAASAPLVIGPIANPGGPYSGKAGSALSVDGSGSSDVSGTLTTYAWNWGDGTSANSSSAGTSHTYTNAGTYTVTLTVSDSGGSSTPVATTAMIAAGQQPPVAIACPVPSVMSPTGGSVAVTFAPTVTGGTAPVTTSCTPPSGSLFPVGTTTISCSATDAAHSTASCSSTVTVTGCNSTVTPTSASATAAGGAASVSVTTTGSCSWAATSNAGWIRVTSGGNGAGNGSVGFSVAANTSTSSRTGTLTVAGQAVTVNQSGASVPSNCAFSVSPTSRTVGSQGGSESTSVTSASGCPWQAASNATSWITITNGASGSSNGSVAYSVSPNPFSSSRTGTLTVAGSLVSVTQTGGTSLCPTTVSPLSQAVAAAGGTESLSVAAAKRCAWAAVSNVSWLTIVPGTTLTGNRSLKYSVAANSGAQRSGTMTIAGHTVTVTQAAAVVPTPTPAPTPTPTPTVPSPLGLTTIGTSLDTGDSNYLVGSPVVTTTGGTVGSITVWVGPTDPNNVSYQVAIYTDNNGAPGSLFALSAVGTLTANSWNTLPITAKLQAGTTYWLMYNSNGSNMSVNDIACNLGAIGVGAFSQSPVAFGTWPSAFPPAYLSDDLYSMFVTFVQ